MILEQNISITYFIVAIGLIILLIIVIGILYFKYSKIDKKRSLIEQKYQELE